MDPNANLDKQRRIAKRLAADDYPNDRERCAAGVRLAELVVALDEWILRGGFLPSPWSIEGRGRR